MTTSLSDSGVTFADGNIQTYAAVAVRQTVLNGPVDTNGQSAFGGATGGTTVTTTGTLYLTAANGMTNRNSIAAVNPSWSGLSTNGTMYLYADINVDGTITTGSNAVLPLYQFGGTPAITSGQFTFNIQQMQGFIGNGTTAPAGNRVYVGEVTVAAGVVSAIVWYALQRRYRSANLAFPTASAPILFPDNIGTLEIDASVWLINVTAEAGYSPGERAVPLSQQSSGTGVPPLSIKDRNTIRVSGGVTNIFTTVNASTGVNTGLTAANWNYFVQAKGSW